MSQTLQAKAHAVAEQVGGAQKADLSLLFDAISAVLTAVIQLLRDKCAKPPAQALQEATAGGLFHRMQVRRLARQKLGRGQLRRYEGRVEDGVLEAGRHTTLAEMEAMYAEAPAGADDEG